MVNYYNTVQIMTALDVVSEGAGGRKTAAIFSNYKSFVFVFL